MNSSGSRRPTGADRRARNRLILEARSTGKTWPEIAEEFEMTERTARRAAGSAARLAAEAGLADLDVERLVEDSVRAQAHALYRLRELMLRERGAVAVGACKAVVSVSEGLRNSLITAGLLRPPQDAWLGREIDRAVAAFVRAAEATGVPTELILDELRKDPQVERRIG